MHPISRAFASGLSSTSPVEEAFWRRFVAEHHTRGPAVYRQPFGQPFVEAGEVFAWTVAAAERRRQGLVGPRFRLYGQDGELAGAPVDCLPTAADGGFAGWLDRVEAEHPELGMVCNDLQAIDPALWSRVRRFLSGLFSRVGLPPGGAMFDLFVGRYRRGFFGLHKDDQDVLTFVIEGKKRFLVWPFETFAGEPGFDPGARLLPARLGEIEARYRDEAVLLEGGPGDLLYWPAEWWHLPVSPDGDLAVTAGFGLFRGSNPLLFYRDAVQGLLEESALPPPPLERLPVGGDLAAEAERALDAVLDWLRHPSIRARAVEQLLGWSSGMGFQTLPDPAPAPELAPNDRLRADPPGALAWAVTDGEVLRWSAGGRVFRYPYHPGFVWALERLNAGETLGVGALEAALATPWEREGGWEGEGGPVELDPPVIHAFLGQLLRQRAVCRVADGRIEQA